jgi:cytochrome P460
MEDHMRGVRAIALLAALPLVHACNRTGEQGTAADSIANAPAQPSAAPAAAAADTTADALWARLQQENYTTWALWPGKQKLYSGQEPHGALLTTYVNALAQDALTNGADRMPEGAIIVKENYGPDQKLMAATVMEKVPGYDPNNGDWFWAKYGADGKAEVSGRVDMCYGCHKGAAQYDHLWTLAKDKGVKSPPPMKMK